MKNFKIIILFLFLLTPIFVFAQEVKNGDIIINEVMWGGSEWIELYNTTDKEIQIDNWSIDGAKTKTESNSAGTLEGVSGKIPADGYFLICDNEYINKIKCDFPKAGLSLTDLPNSNGDLILKDKNRIVIDTAVGDKWPAGKKTGSGENTKYYSMERINPNVSGSEKCNWDTAKEENSFSIDNKTYFGTPKEKNSQFSTDDCTIFYADAGENIISVIGEEITFDASQSKGRIKKYTWNFGDGNTAEGEKVIYKYKFPGKYIVSLIISDGEKEDSDTIEVSIFPNSIFISEFSPKDKWIEIVNESDQIQDISGFSISTKNDEIEFTFPLGAYIAPRSFILLSGNKFVFSDDFVSFFYPSGDLVYKIAYNKKISLSFSVVKKGNEYFYTEIKTPGMSNIINWEEGVKNQQSSSSATSANNPTLNKSKNIENSEKIIEVQKPSLNSEKNLNNQEKKQAKNSTAATKKFLPTNLLAKANQKQLVLSSFGVVTFAGLSGSLLVRKRHQIKQKKPSL